MSEKNPTPSTPPTDGVSPSSRDWLAVDRTILANERTLLAYVRTALAFVAAGLSFVHFFDSDATAVLGWILVPVGAITLLIGVRHYLRIRAQIRRRV